MKGANMREELVEIDGGPEEASRYLAKSWSTYKTDWKTIATMSSAE